MEGWGKFAGLSFYAEPQPRTLSELYVLSCGEKHLCIGAVCFLFPNGNNEYEQGSQLGLDPGASKDPSNQRPELSVFCVEPDGIYVAGRFGPP